MTEITDIKQQQEILNRGLLEFKRICEKNNIKYYLSNGTLLGAVKYKGFIPWDDDVDVLVPRYDYDRLIGLAEAADYCDDFKIISHEINPLWKMPYSKLYHTKTIAAEETADLGVKIGLSIDIFPLDAWHTGTLAAKIQACYCALLRRFMTASVMKEFDTKKKGIQRILLLIVWKVSHILGEKRIYKLISKQCAKSATSKKTQFYGSVAWAPYGTRDMIPVSYFENITEVTFEGERYTAFGGFDSYLRNLYGDYEKDLPADKQKSHHGMRVWQREI